MINTLTRTAPGFQISSRLYSYLGCSPPRCGTQTKSRQHREKHKSWLWNINVQLSTVYPPRFSVCDVNELLFQLGDFHLNFSWRAQYQNKHKPDTGRFTIRMFQLQSFAFVDVRDSTWHLDTLMGTSGTSERKLLRRQLKVFTTILSWASILHLLTFCETAATETCRISWIRSSPLWHTTVMLTPKRLL